VAADDVSLKLEPGTITALVGPNGSGKTTILRLLGGTLAPDAGTIAVDRNDVTDAAADRRVQAGVVRTLQTRTVFAGLTVLDSALVGANRTRRYGGALRALVSTPLHRLESRESERAAATALAAVGLGNGTDRPADVLAGSARQRLMLAAALATEPAVLLLDEPSAGASRDERHELARLLRRLREDGLAILLVEHDLTLVRAVADEVVELDGGRIVRQGRD
jgi:branched-chain amino acid transport system ATP-binding protein